MLDLEKVARAREKYARGFLEDSGVGAVHAHFVLGKEHCSLAEDLTRAAGTESGIVEAAIMYAFDHDITFRAYLRSLKATNLKCTIFQPKKF